MRFPQEILPDVIVYFKQLQRKGIKSVYLSKASGEDTISPGGGIRSGAGTGARNAAGRTARPDAAGKNGMFENGTKSIAVKSDTGLAQLRKKVSACTECPLCETRTHTVFGVGNPRTSVMFVGEAPGRDEDLKGEPFVGRAGQLLNKILSAIDLKRDDVYITNILKCRPPQNRDPQESEIRCCEKYLKKQIELIEPKILCALGRISAQWLLQTDAPLGTLRTGEYYYEGIRVLPTYHPAALLRNPAFKKPAWEDFKKLKALLEK